MKNYKKLSLLMVFTLVFGLTLPIAAQGGEVDLESRFEMESGDLLNDGGVDEETRVVVADGSLSYQMLDEDLDLSLNFKNYFSFEEGFGDLDDWVNTLEVNPKMDYENHVWNATFVGLDTEAQFEKVGDKDVNEKLYSVKPYLNYEEEVVQGLVMGSRNSLDYRSENGLDEFEDVITLTPFVEYEKDFNEILTYGVDSSYSFESQDNFGEESEFDFVETATIKPYLGLDYDLTYDLNFNAELAYEMLGEDIREESNEFENTLTVDPSLEYERKVHDNVNLVADSTFEMKYQDDLEGYLNSSLGVSLEF